jgi:prevent-host-death family protein
MKHATEKPVKTPAPFSATWELRCGPKNQFRAFYDVNQPPGIVTILAIGVPMTSVTLTKAKARLNEYVDKCQNGNPVVITRNGKAVAVLISPEDDDDLERLLLARSKSFQALLEKSRRSIREGKGLTSE